MPRWPEGIVPKRNEQNRKRNKIFNIHVSEDEYEELKTRIALSGRLQYEFALQSMLTQQIVVLGDKHLLERIEDRLSELEPLLERIAEGNNDERNPLVMAELRMIYEMTERWE